MKSGVNGARFGLHMSMEIGEGDETCMSTSEDSNGSCTTSCLGGGGECISCGWVGDDTIVTSKAEEDETETDSKEIGGDADKDKEEDADDEDEDEDE